MKTHLLKKFLRIVLHWLRVNTGKSTHELILHGCIYRKGASTEDNNKRLLEILTEAVKTNNYLSICGDFNFPTIDWKAFLVKSDNPKSAVQFFDTLNDLFLVQHVKKWTRKRGTDKPSLLDLVITDPNQIIQEPVVGQPLAKSDHGVIVWKSTFKHTPEQPTDEVPKLNFYKGNYKQMKENLATVNWEEEFRDCKDVNSMIGKFEDILNDQVNTNVPLQNKSKQGQRRQAPWINLKAIKAIRRKYFSWKRYQETQSHQKYIQYVKERRKASKKLRKAKKEYEEKLAKECASNSKAFFKYVNSYKKQSTTFIRLKKKYSNRISEAEDGTKDITYPPPQNENTISETDMGDEDRSQDQLVSNRVAAVEKGIEDPAKSQLTSTDKETAEELNHYFKSVFTVQVEHDSAALDLNCFFRTFVDPEENPSFSLPECNVLEDEYLKTIVVSVDDVYELLQRINPNKSAGDDGVHPKVLKECAEQLALPLQKIYQLSISTGTVPDSWKTATVTPLFKDDDRSDAANYRPISITSQVGKVLEKIIRKEIMTYMQKNNLLSDDQHGFSKDRSCLTNLLEALDDITRMVDEGLQVDEIFLDFRKAFDKVSHERLLYKLHHMGIRDDLLAWITSFLKMRKQRVKVNGSMSSWADVTSGVPQGSVLGPILFVIFINDFPSLLQSSVKLFADDAKLYSDVSHANGHLKLQEDLKTCVDWANQWLMLFHPKKCKVIHYGKHSNKLDYTLNGHPVIHVTEEKDLGIKMSEDLKWTTHIADAVKKANRMVGLIKHTFTYMNKEMFLVLYKTLVRPLLEYCPQVWSPNLAKNIEAVEKVQQRATKIVPELHHLPYEERLKCLKLYPLRERRLRGDMIFTYKLLNGLIDIDPSQLAPLHHCPTGTRSHNKQIKGKTPKTLMRKSYFTNRIVHPWNTLSRKTVDSESVQTFKGRYDKERLGSYNIF